MEQKRYNLVLPTEVFDEVKTIADSRNTTVKQLLHRFIKLGLIAIKLDETPGAALIIREGDSEREIVFY